MPLGGTGYVKTRDRLAWSVANTAFKLLVIAYYFEDLCTERVSVEAIQEEAVDRIHNQILQFADRRYKHELVA